MGSHPHWNLLLPLPQPQGMDSASPPPPPACLRFQFHFPNGFCIRRPQNAYNSKCDLRTSSISDAWELSLEMQNSGHVPAGLSQSLRFDQTTRPRWRMCRSDFEKHWSRWWGPLRFCPLSFSPFSQTTTSLPDCHFYILMTFKVIPARCIWVPDIHFDLLNYLHIP